MIDIVGKRYLFFLFSAIIIIPGLISLIIPPGLKLGVDFTGGTLWDVQFQKPPSVTEISAILTAHGYPDSEIQPGANNEVLLRTKEIQPDQPVKAQIASDLQAHFGPMTELSFQSVGPSVGNEIWQRSILAVALASLGILL
ncbi:MAG TPA: protein translocase subunit SecF, partial [Chloroflexota bacterium]|nr:protein translocase subunit SecF [Chloroflexota bacterium]